MNANSDELYVKWWNSYGEFADIECEYPAWRAGRAQQQTNINAEMFDLKKELEALRAIQKAAQAFVWADGRHDPPAKYEILKKLVNEAAK